MVTLSGTQPSEINSYHNIILNVNKAIKTDNVLLVQ